MSYQFIKAYASGETVIFLQRVLYGIVRICTFNCRYNLFREYATMGAYEGAELFDRITLRIDGK